MTEFGLFQINYNIPIMVCYPHIPILKIVALGGLQFTVHRRDKMTPTSYSNHNKRFCLELDRIKLLLKKAGTPEKKMRIIHVAGTNGKGSICSFLEAGLISMDIKCGCFVSPELFTPEDSIRINRFPIETKKLKSIFSKITPLAKAVEEELGKAPSEFEMLFAAALIHFKREKCHTVILECGMGGIGDATNAIDHNDISVLSTISMDHADYLGDTIAQITENKCGIIRDGTQVISADQCPESEDVIIDKCRKNNCQLCFVRALPIKRMEGLNAVVDLRFGEARLSLAGSHQAKNAGVAISILGRIGADDKDIVAAITGATHKARLEEIAPDIYFDGAHNPDGIRALVDTINKAGITGKLSFAVGFMADKDIAGCFEELSHLNNKDIEIFTATVHSNPRSESAEKIKDIAVSKGFNASAHENIRQAVKTAKRSGGTVFVFGSLYMYKEL